MRRQAIERLLPAAYQRTATPGSVLGALLDVMELLHAPSEARLADVDDIFAAYRAPAGFVPMLARWVALDRHLPGGDRHLPGGVPVGRLRDLVAHGADIAQWRGTAAGLRSLIRIATGLAGVEVVEPADRPFHFVVVLPAGGEAQLDLVRRMVAVEKPAAATCDVVVEEAR